MPEADPILRQLEIARRDLLDLSTANRLLRTVRDQPRGAAIEIKDEIAAEVFGRLVKDVKEMHFEQGVETEDASGVKRTKTKKAASKKSEPESPVDRQTDDLLHTEIEAGELDRRLLSLVTDSSASFEEKGINVLFLGIGFLRWYEAERPDRANDAPLLLIPVTLTRSQASQRYSLKYTGDEIETNLTLKIRLKVDFGIDLPELPDTDDLSASAYFSEVNAAIESQPSWEVLSDDMVLWFFSFTKLLMYRDLDPESWTGAARLEDRPLIRALMSEGFPPVQSLCRDDESIDPLFDPAQTTHVIDCDSSQSLVIEEACRGRSMVIQGPPGTGKSQTITNLIAAAVKSGKTILFVAEKMAALEVVKRRLDNIGIGDLCLELHSSKANKRAVLEEVSRTLKLGAPVVPNELEKTIKRLRETRDQLNQNVNRLHTPVQPGGRSPYQVITELIDLRSDDVPLPTFQLPEAATWTGEQTSAMVAAVGEVSQAISNMGSPKDHPWRGCELDNVLPLDLERMLVAIPPQIQSLDDLAGAGRTLAQRFSEQPPTTLAQVDQWQRTVTAIFAAPPHDPTAAGNTVWTDHRVAVHEIAELSRAILLAKTELSSIVNDSAWDSDVLAARDAYALYGQSWFRMLRSSYRAARNTLKTVLSGPSPDTFEARLRVLDLLAARQRAIKKLNESSAVGEKAFGRVWLGGQTDWSRIDAWEAWDTAAERSDVLPRFRQMLGMVEEPEKLKSLLEDLKTCNERFIAGFGALCQSLKINLGIAFAKDQLAKNDAPVHRLAPADGSLLVDLRQRMLDWQSSPEGLQHWRAFERSQKQIEKVGEGVVAKLINSQELPHEQAPRVFRFAVAEAVLRDMFAKNPELDRFDGAKTQALIDEFCDLDIRRLELARAEVAQGHWQGISRKREGDFAEAVSLLQHEMQKKRRHLPLRMLLGRAGAAIQAVKPVFMMSPLSVAQYLEAGTLDFDLLLIDEASQVRPVEALGAAARCRQMVCVGDDQQMPPSQFFGATVGDVDLDDGQSPDMQAGDVESVLGLCIARNMPQRMLRWHYRSKHESLIAVSNREFYDSQLYIVPSPQRGGELGVKWNFIEGSRFDKGQNDVEAKAVATAIMNHAKTRPDWSLGVGAFSVSQRDAILLELEEMRRADSSCEKFFDPADPNPFFVKNLENIQGDERDVIFVSVGYGPDENGKVNMNFGPVSMSGGERRLNVLMTRAKRICEIFSSIRAEDIDLNRATGRGPAVFREYLKFAQTGGEVGGAANNVSTDPLIAVLKRELTERGYQVQTRVGIAGVFVDLAVIDPEDPSRYLLGVDIDGDSYRDSRSARDRDRTRIGVLGGQGWRIHQMWSLDWFRRPTEQFNGLIEAIEAARHERGSIRGPRLASTESTIQRKLGGPDPLSMAVADAQAVPARSQSNMTKENEPSFSMSEVLGTAIKVGGAVMTAKEGKGLDAAIRVLTSKKK